MRLRKFRRAYHLFEGFEKKIIESFKMQRPSQFFEDGEEMPQVRHPNIPAPPHIEEFLATDVEFSRVRNETAALAEAKQETSSDLIVTSGAPGLGKNELSALSRISN